MCASIKLVLSNLSLILVMSHKHTTHRLLGLLSGREKNMEKRSEKNN